MASHCQKHAARHQKKSPAPSQRKRIFTEMSLWAQFDAWATPLGDELLAWAAPEFTTSITMVSGEGQVVEGWPTVVRDLIVN